MSTLDASVTELCKCELNTIISITNWL